MHRNSCFATQLSQYILTTIVAYTGSCLGFFALSSAACPTGIWAFRLQSTSLIFLFVKSTISRTLQATPWWYSCWLNLSIWQESLLSSMRWTFFSTLLLSDKGPMLAVGMIQLRLNHLSHWLSTHHLSKLLRPWKVYQSQVVRGRNGSLNAWKLVSLWPFVSIKANQPDLSTEGPHQLDETSLKSKVWLMTIGVQSNCTLQEGCGIWRVLLVLWRRPDDQ